MLERAIGLLAKKEIALIKRRFAGLLVLLGSLILVPVGLAFLSLSLFLWLSERMPAWQAALFVSIPIFLVSLVLWLAGKLMMRRRHSINEELDEEIRTIAAILLPETGAAREKKVWSLVVIAALIGMIAGRSSGK
jgi:hypothetical protein